MPSSPSDDAIRLFLSYAREDYEEVSDVYDRLKALGLRPWMDKRDLVGGQRWESKLKQEIRKSHFFLAFLSAKSVAKRGYLQREFKQALQLWQEKLDDDIYLIPVRLDDCQVPESLSQFHRVNLYDEDGWRELLRALRTGGEQSGLKIPRALQDIPVARKLRKQAALLAAVVILGGVLIVGYFGGWFGAAVPPTALPGAPPATEVQGTPESTLARAPDVFDPLVVTRPIHMELVRMPAWEFVMGSDPAKQKSAEPNEKPEHRVSLPGYYMSKYEVTNAQYRAFVNATGHAVPAHWVQGTIPVGEEQHPVVYVSWYDAQAFADWVRGESGRAFRLPTEAEWEKACRTAQGSLYPWGDSLPDSATANFGATMGDTTRVGTHSPQGDSTHGTADMAGNVAEWTNSLPRPYPYLVTDGRENESDPGPRIVRGGAYWNDAAHVRCASRSSVVPVVRNDSTGFRLALSSAP